MRPTSRVLARSLAAGSLKGGLLASGIVSLGCQSFTGGPPVTTSGLVVFVRGTPDQLRNDHRVTVSLTEDRPSSEPVTVTAFLPAQTTSGAGTMILQQAMLVKLNDASTQGPWKFRVMKVDVERKDAAGRYDYDDSELEIRSGDRRVSNVGALY